MKDLIKKAEISELLFDAVSTGKITTAEFKNAVKGLDVIMKVLKNEK